MTAYYLSMRLKQFWRFFPFNGFNPLAGIVLSVVVFAVLSLLVFEKAPEPGWVYLAMAILGLAELQSSDANSYLKEHTTGSAYYSCKLVENILIAIPFAAILLFKQAYLQVGCLFAFIPVYSIANISIPKPKLRALKSPFPAHAFEWHFAFRLFPVVYVLHILLMIPAVIADNFYIMLVPFILLLFILITAYGMLEDRFMIWVYRKTAKAFLWSKFKSLFVGYNISYALFMIVGLIFFTGQAGMLFMCYAAGLIGLTGCMLIKYHFYPGAIVVQISQFVFLGFVIGCFFNPAMVILCLLLMMFSYYKAVAKLKSILSC